MTEEQKEAIAMILAALAIVGSLAGALLATREFWMKWIP